MKLRRLTLSKLPTLFPVLLVAYGVNVFAQDDTPAIGFSQWQCKYCEFDKGASTSLELGLGYVSDELYRLNLLFMTQSILKLSNCVRVVHCCC